jgi:hypothetical protein
MRHHEHAMQYFAQIRVGALGGYFAYSVRLDHE